MSWIDDRIAESNAKKQRTALIRDNAETVFEALWDEVRRYVDEAQTKGFALLTSGCPDQRAVVWKDDALKITLNRSAGKIEVSVPNTNFVLPFSVGDGNIVCLSHKDKPVSLKRVAELMLDPLLFPDLQG